MLEEIIQQLDNFTLGDEEKQVLLLSPESDFRDELELSDKEKLELANNREEIKENYFLIEQYKTLFESLPLFLEKDPEPIIKELFDFSALSENPNKAYPSPEKILKILFQQEPRPENANFKKQLEKLLMNQPNIEFAAEILNEIESSYDKSITIDQQEADLENPIMKKEQDTCPMEKFRKLHELRTTLEPSISNASRLMDAFSYIGKILACKQALNLDLTTTISDFLNKHPECRPDWSSCKQYITGLDRQDIKELEENYISSLFIQLCNERNVSPLTITPKLKKDPHANTSACFGGFFLEQKPSDRKLLHFFEKANDKIRIAIEILFEALCAGGYLEKRIEVLHAFVYNIYTVINIIRNPLI